MRALAQEQSELVSAAVRHVRDAEHLAAPGPDQSLDQAWHLAGFGPEAIRKACLDLPGLNKKLGHDFGPVAEALLDTVLALDAHAARYDLRGWGAKLPILAKWTPEARYAATGTAMAADVAALVATARQCVDNVVAALWADGRIGGVG